MKRNGLTKRNILIAFAAVIVIAAGVAWHYGAMAYKTYDADAVRIYIPRDASTESIADTLSKRLGDYGTTVYKLWKLRDGEAEKAYGSYVINRDDKAWSVMNRLRTGHQTPVKVSFNNIRTINELADRVASKMEFSTEDFNKALDKILPRRGFKKETYAAAFLPDTYEFYWTDSAEKVVKKFVEVRNRFWTEDRCAMAEIQSLTPVGVAIIASIVEEETAKEDERPTVARLYMNRLAAGMKLQADPTVKFAVGDFSLRRITGEHLKVNSPYNTYLYPGLPPGPIRIAERSTLDAVLSAPKHDYLYMCAKDDFSGYHVFEHDYSAHQENARRYQARLNDLNIK